MTKSAQELAIELTQFQKLVTEELAKGHHRMSRIEQDIREQNDTLAAIKSDTTSVKDLLETWRAGRFAFIGLGRITLWVVTVTGTVTLIVQAARGKIF